MLLGVSLGAFARTAPMIRLPSDACQPNVEQLAFYLPPQENSHSEIIVCKTSLLFAVKKLQYLLFYFTLMYFSGGKSLVRR